jgi:hypothetical protein
VKPTQHIATSASTPTVGFFATLCGLLGAKGTGAPPPAAVTLSPLKRTSRAFSIATPHLPTVGFVITLVAACVLAVTTSVALAAAPELPETAPASMVTTATAVLNGVLNPKAKASDAWFFEYNAGAVCKGGRRTPVHPEEEVQAKAVSAEVTGLALHTEYTFCLVARNAEGEATAGNAVSFTTGTSPWWSVTAGSRPTNLSAAPGKDEVQTLTVAATKGDFVLGNPETCVTQILELLEERRTEVTACGVLPFNATVAQVQATLARAFPERTVHASGGPADQGTGAVVSGSTEVTGVVLSAGAFAVGQEILAKGVPVGATIKEVEPHGAGTLTLSQAATETRSGDVLSSALAPFTITFPEQAVAPVFVVHGFLASFLGAEPLELPETEPEPGVHEPQPGVVTATETQAGAESDNQIVVTAVNLGDAQTAGKITIEDQLPPGLSALVVRGVAGGPGGYELGKVLGCAATGKGVKCEIEKLEHNGVIPAVLPPYEQIELKIAVSVGTKATSGELNAASVSGGGAGAGASTSHKIEVGGPLRFGIEEYSLIPEEEGGAIDTQAGSHPFQITSIVTFNSQGPDAGGRPRTVALPKNVIAKLPPGFIGNPTPFAQCTDAQFAKSEEPEERGKLTNACPASSAIGVASLSFNEPATVGFGTVTAPIFNMVPREGEPARFGILAAGIVSAFLDTSIRTGGDYGVTVSSLNIPEIQWLLGAKLTFWGTPGSSVHDGQRGWDCLYGLGGASGCPSSLGHTPPPFLVMPSSCAAPWESKIDGESWSAPGKPTEVAETFTYHLPEAIDGCDHLPFAPEIKVSPDVSTASSPTGLNVDVHVPQTAILNSESLAESAVKNIEVALPPGVAVNPAGSDGLQACSEGLVGFTGLQELDPGGEPGIPTALFTPGIPEPLESGINFCAGASKIGTVTIKTPLLPPGQFVTGSVYLATQNQNPFGSLIALYIVAKDPISGATVKLAGETHLTPSGQIVTTFKNSPQLAFEDAELHFFGGERAPLSTPAHCGAYTTTASFGPWSGNAPVPAASTFNINAGPNNSPCPGASLPFSPSLTGGTSNINAGSFSPLVTTIGREDGEQDMQSVQLQMPLGVEGVLTGVKLCPEAQANEGTCGPESEIGETIVSAGVGNDPVSVVGGKVYLTEKYAGAPFGLSIVNPVKAGPFDLERDTSNPAQNPACDCVVVRAKIEVNPQSAGLTVTTDASGPHAIPHLIDGIPVQIKRVNVTIGREHFIFNPTSCTPQALTGSIASDEGALQPLSVPFQATNCAVLKFTPRFTATTSAVASKVNGATVGFHISYAKGAMGSQSWFNEAKFEIPKQLPARLTTIQQACLAATFEHNRAACPPHSIIGHGIVHTPVLPVPLEGPVYFVSHGGAKFPDAVVVLDGYGVHIELVGETFINGKTGVTSATFRNTPDVPFESFDVTLPAGRYSEFGANLPHEGRNFCGQKLVMPTFFKASNGVEIHQRTPVGVTGCGKSKTRAQKLAAALKVCHKKHNKRKRQACETAAHKAYGAKVSRHTGKRALPGRTHG